MNRRRISWIAVAAIAALLIATQVIIPGYVADRIDSRLTRHGGEATTSVSAFPALRLLFGDGKRLSSNADGVGLDLTAARERPLERLDGFDDVQVAVRDSYAGPLRVDRMTLDRDGSGPYRFTWAGSVTLADVAGSAAGELGPLAGIAAGIAAGSVPNADEPLPIDLNMALESDGGRLRVVSGGGTVAGFPTGPLAALLMNAIAVRL